jgi:hypothetical protein
MKKAAGFVKKHKLVAAGALLVALIVMMMYFRADMFRHNRQTKSSSFVGSVVVEKVDPNHLPQFIQADFIDLSKVFQISRFRSGAGHDFSDGTETCRSMKHYFEPQGGAELHKDATGISPKPDGATDTSVFSPVDGTIVRIDEERTPIGRQIFIRPTSHKGFTIRLFHVFLDSGFGVNTTVTAGQKIGVIGQYQGMDVSVEYVTDQQGDSRYVSYFAVMPDNIFAHYIARGAKTREDFITTKAFRDAHALQCASNQDGGAFYDTRDDTTKNTEDFFYLSGYIPAAKKTTS